MESTLTYAVAAPDSYVGAVGCIPKPREAAGGKEGIFGFRGSLEERQSPSPSFSTKAIPPKSCGKGGGWLWNLHLESKRRVWPGKGTSLAILGNGPHFGCQV